MLTRSPVPARATSASPSSFHTTRSHNHNHPHHAFHYASSASPQIRSPKPSAAVSRRQSSSSLTASSLGLSNNNNNNDNNKASQSQPQAQAQSHPPPPSNRPPPQADQPAAYVAVDAATQYSPMEPHDYFTTPDAPAKSKYLAGVDSPSAHASTKTTTQSQPQSLPAAEEAAAAATASSSSSRTAVSTIHRPQASTNGDVSLQEGDPATPGPSDGPPMLKAPHPLSPSKRRNSDAPGLLVGGRPSGEGGDGAATGGVPKRVKPEAAPPKVLPVQYELCAYEDIVVLIAHMLAELIETNDALALRSGHLTRFHSRTAPGISVLDYLLRLAKHATLSPPLLLSMVYYIDRLCALYPDFTINTLTVHRFLITAATVAAKGLSDSFWNNSTYARVGGVRVAELKLLELEFLHKVDWKIVPDPDVLVAYYRGLVQRCPAYQLEDEVGGEEDDDATAIADESDGSEVSNDPDEGDEQEEGKREAVTKGTMTTAQGKPPDAPSQA